MNARMSLAGRVELTRYASNPRTGLWEPTLRYRAPNVVVEAAKTEILKRVRFLEGSDRVIRKMAVGTGRAAPEGEDTALDNQIAVGDIDEFDDAGLEGATPFWRALRQWQPEEANSSVPGITEVALLFDNDDLASRALFGQGEITGATQANPVVVTSEAHGLANGDQVYVEDVGGMTEINDRVFTVAEVAANTFELEGENGTGHTAFTSDGKWTKTATKTSSEILEVRYRWTLS